MHAGGCDANALLTYTNTYSHTQAWDANIKKTKRHVLTRKQAYTQCSLNLPRQLRAGEMCVQRAVACVFVCDILGCDSVTGAWWFPKQPVSLTEGLLVKENTGKNLSMSNEQRERGEGAGGGVDCNRERALLRLKRPVRAKIGRRRKRSVKRQRYRVFLRKRDKIQRGRERRDSELGEEEEREKTGQRD